jgi:multicomponent Na+:H+ antiporter subunit F
VIEIATTIAFALLGLGLLATLVRLVRGPSIGDRILALDMMTLVAAGVIAVFAVRTGRYLYIDIAVALALLSFLATIAFARYLVSRSES